MVEIVWSEEALKSWSEIVDYLILEFGIESVERFQENLEEWEDTLSHSPFIGKEEPLLSHSSSAGKKFKQVNKLKAQQLVNLKTRQLFYVSRRERRDAEIFLTDE